MSPKPLKKGFDALQPRASIMQVSLFGENADSVTTSLSHFAWCAASRTLGKRNFNQHPVFRPRRKVALTRSNDNNKCKERSRIWEMGNCSSADIIFAGRLYFHFFKNRHRKQSETSIAPNWKQTFLVDEFDRHSTRWDWIEKYKNPNDQSTA